jgi:WhiB family redox-sensing transcriptional regulator
MLHYIASQAGPMPDLSAGLCVGSKQADNWHADQHREAKERLAAKNICRTCPVLSECRDYAMANPSLSGTWGGTTEQDRHRIRNRIPAQPSRRLSLIA